MKHLRTAIQPTYQECFAAQIGGLGANGQRPLRHSVVVVAGAGGLGTTICTILANVGVGTLVVVDPQRLEPENFNRYAFARVSDIGKRKVDVVAGFFVGRPHVSVIPVFGHVERIDLGDVVRRVDLVVAASNTISSRLALARFAVSKRIPQVAAGVADAREVFGGSIVSWIPELGRLACPACFLRPGSRLVRRESLVASVVAMVGAVAASMAVGLLARDRRSSELTNGNFIAVDVMNYNIARLRVRSRADCPACGPQPAISATNS